MYKVVDLFWERANLHFVLNKSTSKKVYLKSNKLEILLKVTNKEISINLTNTPEGMTLPAGKYNLYVEDDIITIDTKLLKVLDDKSRLFMYRKNKYAYTVRFDTNSVFNLNIITKFMIENRHPERFYRLFEAKTLKDKMKIILKRTAVWSFNLFYKTLHIMYKNKKNILFLTENANELNANLKVLYEYLKDDNYKINIFADNKFEGKKNAFKYVKETILIAKSKIIFVDNYTPILTHLKLNKNVKLVQLWHAGVGFKAVGYARFGINGSPHPYKSCHRYYTHAIVDQDKLIDVYKEVFGTKSEIFISCGIPRLDGYVTKEKINATVTKMYELNPKIKDNNVVLFSPTYRGTGSKGAYYDYSLLDLEAIYKFCTKNNFIFIIKMHPFISEKIEIPKKFRNKIFDYSNLDINELIYISDIMITDYSSCAYEFSLFNRPLIFYRFDKEIYEYERPMHTVDAFTSKQYEVKEFSEVMKLLEKLKDEIPKDRFTSVKNIGYRNSCEVIKKEIIGD